MNFTRRQNGYKNMTKIRTPHTTPIPEWYWFLLKFLAKRGFITNRTKEWLVHVWVYKDLTIRKSRNRHTVHLDYLIKKYKVCQICGSDQNLTQDHKIPRSKGGSNSLANKWLLCLKCNMEKGDSLNY